MIDPSGSKSARSRRPLVLGVCGSFHDTAAVLMRGGEIVGALEEERVTRARHDGSPFPRQAVRRLLSHARASWDDIERVALAWDYELYDRAGGTPGRGELFFDALHRQYAEQQGIALENLMRRDVFERNAQRFTRRAVADSLAAMAAQAGSAYVPPATFVRHHLAHAASAYFGSGFREPCLVVTLDGYGDTETTTAWLGCEGTLTELRSIPIPHSLGWVYASVTEYLGFRPLFSEGEVMGLSSYGHPQTPREVQLADELRAFMEDYVWLADEGWFGVNADYLYFGDFSCGYTRVSRAMVERLKGLVPASDAARVGAIDPRCERDRPRVILAFALQNRIEEAIVHMVRHFLDADPRTKGTKAIALAGGVGYNIKANSRLLSEGLVTADRLFVHPAAGDAGAALGAAMVVYRDEYGHDPRQPRRRIDLGPAYDDADIARALSEAQLREGEDYVDLGDADTIAQRTAELLAERHVVAWFQGGSEFGPRALGFRSVLLNPTDPRADQIANSVKRREYWRPSAISVAAECAARYFEGWQAGPHAAFMNVAYGVKSENGDLLRSGRHPADGTTRPQAVARDDNPLFWNLLHRFARITGIAALVNTSFNRQEPLVESPEEAINTFAYMQQVDALVIGRFLLTSRDRIVPSIFSAREHPAAAALFEPERVRGHGIDWDAIMALAEPKARIHRIIVELRGSRGDHRLTFPLIKELFDPRTGVDLGRHLAGTIMSEAKSRRADHILVHTTSRKYDLIVYEALRASAQSGAVPHPSAVQCPQFRWAGDRGLESAPAPHMASDAGSETGR